MQQFRVSAEDAGKRTDIFVSQKFPQYARSALKDLFRDNLVLVNGNPEEPGDRLRAGDIVSVDSGPLDYEPEDIELPIIYEDDNVVVIDKPAGLLTHSKGALNREPTVASFIKKRLNDTSLGGNRAGIIHRLDRATSGVIICAKNSASLSHLQKQFSQRKAKKTYRAIVEGALEPPEAVIDIPIERNPKRPQTFRPSSNGKQSQTKYRLTRVFTRNNRTYSEVELSPLTGRTHQIRVHLSYLKHPIVGDNVYGTGDGNLMLHASALELTLPGGERRVFTSKLPPRMVNFERGK